MKSRPASKLSTESTAQATVGVARINANYTIGRRDDNAAETRVDIRNATFRIGDPINSKHKRINPS